MQSRVMNLIFLACLATALTSEPETRSRRHLHDMQHMIAYKLFIRNEPNCTRYQPGTRPFQIPSFIEGGVITPPPLIDIFPLNPHIDFAGSYLGTHSPHETYNVLLGANDIFKSGNLHRNHGPLHKPSVLKTTTQKPVTPCPIPKPAHRPTVKPIGVIAKPPIVPETVLPRYSYKQINQDGSMTTWTSYLDFNKGVKVTQNGKNLPFIIDRMRKVPVQVPVPVLPEVSTILNPYDANFGNYYPAKVNQPGSSYSYQQKHHDDRLTSYTGLNPFYEYSNNNGPVVVKVTGNKPPPSLFFDNVPLGGSYPKAPVVEIIEPKPLSFGMPAENVIYEAPVFDNPGYSYNRIRGSGGASTAHRVEAYSAPLLNVLPSISETNPVPSAPYFSPYSYNQDYFGVLDNYAGSRKSGVQKNEGDFSKTEPHALRIQSPSPNSFSYKEANNDGKVTSYNGAQVNNQPAHFTVRKQNVATESKVNGIYNPIMPLVDQFAYPVPNDFVQIPSVERSAPQKPIKAPSASGSNSFLYKYVHRDGSITSYGADGSINDKVNQPDTSYAYQQIKESLHDHTLKPEIPTVQGNTRVFESPIYTNPFSIDVNTNAFKPSSPVSTSFSYKLLNNGSVDYHYDTSYDEASPAPESEGNKPFSVSPLLPISPAPVQSHVEPDSQYPPNSIFGQTSNLNQEVIPQTNYPQPNPLLALNVDNPATNNVNLKKSHSNHHQYDSDLSQNYNADFYPTTKDYVNIPPAHFDEIPPTVQQFNFSRLPPKSFSNRYLYDNFDGYNFRDENFYLPPSTPKPQEKLADNFYGTNSDTYNRVMARKRVSTPKPADNIYVEEIPAQIHVQPYLSNRNPVPNYPEQVSIPNSPVHNVHNDQISIEIPSSAHSSSNQHNSLISNPVASQAKTSFLFKQSNVDGSSITTMNDGNTLSVQVEEAREPVAVQDEQSLGNMEEAHKLVDDVPNSDPVQVPVEEAIRPEPELSTEMPGRRKINRVKVKQQGDIPDNFYDTGSLEQAQNYRKSVLSDQHTDIYNRVVARKRVSTPKPADNIYVEKISTENPFNFQPYLSNRNSVLNYPAAPVEQVSIPNIPENSVNDDQISIEIPSSPYSFPNHSLTSNPLTSQAKSSFLFKQSNVDGSSITTTNDGNALSVQVEEAREPAGVKDGHSLGNEEAQRLVDDVPNPVPVQVAVEEAVRPEPEPSTEMPRRRKINRVKVEQQTDIPDNVYGTGSLDQVQKYRKSVLSDRDSETYNRVVVRKRPAAVQDEQSLGNVEETQRLVDNVPNPVPVQVVMEEAVRPEPEPSTEMPRRRKISRVKVEQQADIPDNVYGTGSLEQVRNYRKSVLSDRDSEVAVEEAVRPEPELITEMPRRRKIKRVKVTQRGDIPDYE